MERDAYLDALRDFCDRLFGGLLEGLGKSGKMLLERTPWHVYSLELIGAVYPDAYVIHIVRDGRDVVRSLMAQDWGPHDPRAAAEEWMASVRAARSSADALQHYIELRYEDLLADPRAEVTRLLTWLGLDSGNEVVERALIEAGVEFNVDPGSRGVSSEKWRTGMNPKALGVVERVAGSLLIESGYSLSSEAAGRTAGVSARRVPRQVVLAGVRLVRRVGRVQPSDLERAVVSRVDESQQLVDQLLIRIARGDLAGVAELTSPSVRVRLVEDQTWEGRGQEALDRLAASLLEDPVRNGRQIRGEIFPALPTTTVVTIHLLDTGMTAHRVLAVDVQGGRITGLTRIAGVRPMTHGAP